jgi:hypothetical protein
MLLNQEIYLYFFFLKRGPGHQLLEHPDKDGNLPLMHACTKLDIGSVKSLIAKKIEFAFLFFIFQKSRLVNPSWCKC